MASSKLHRAAAGDQDELNVDMSPMIDMVFLLLIFFIVASSVIVVKQDPEVEPPIAKNSLPATDGKGRIVVNIYEDGRCFTEVKEELLEEKDIEDYVTKRKDEEKAKGLTPIIHLRGDEAVPFQHTRRVIRSAARAGVDNVVFSVYGFAKKKN